MTTMFLLAILIFSLLSPSAPLPEPRIDMAALTASEQQAFRDKLIMEGADDDLSQRAMLESIQAATLPDEPLPGTLPEPAARAVAKQKAPGAQEAQPLSPGSGIGSQIDAMMRQLRGSNEQLAAQVKTLRGQLMKVNEHRTQDDARVARLEKDNKLLRDSYRGLGQEVADKVRRERAVVDLLSSDVRVLHHGPVNVTMVDGGEQVPAAQVATQPTS